jgi:glycosyltransferase involved in cell wall biosynthesis
VCKSEFPRATLCRHYERARAKSRVVWCGHAFGAPDDGAPAAARNRDGRDGRAKPPLLLTFAHRPHKNAEAAVRILARLHASEPEFRLTVVGAGAAEKESILRLARELRVGGAVEAPARVEDAELARLYGEATCLVFLSRYEGFGLPALEAMALGCPVVVSDRGALPEVVAGHAPVLDCDDWEGAAAYVARLRADPALWGETCERARRWALQWTWERMVDETVRAYRDLLASREPRVEARA